MTRHWVAFGSVLAAITFTYLASLSGAGGTVTGTVKVTGLASSADAGSAHVDDR